MPPLTYLFRWLCPWHRPQWIYFLFTLSEDGCALYVTIKTLGKDSVWGKDLLANLINVLMFPPFFPTEIVYGSDSLLLVIVTVCVNFFSYILGPCISQQGAQLIFLWFDGFSSRARDTHFHLCFLAAPICSVSSASGAPLALDTVPQMKVVIGG